MARIAAHINDAGITVLDAERIRYREPGFALLDHRQLITGNQAYQNARINPRSIQHRYWSDLSLEPLADRRFSHLTAADLVSAQLEHVQQADGSGGIDMIVAVPSYMTSQNLGLFLGICSELGIEVVAMVDAAVAATRREYRNAVPVHIDLSLHSASLTRLSQPGHSQVERSELLDGCGVFSLYDAWINVVAAAFVRQSRFDPLHTAATEQMLLNRLGSWLSSASSHDSVTLEMENRGASYTAEIEVINLIDAAAPVYETIASKLRALFHAEDIPAIQVSDRVGRLPGLLDMLKARVGGEVYVLEAGATARGALARLRDRPAADGGVSLLRQLPWDQAPVEITRLATDQSEQGVPTHLLFGHTAFSIGNSPLYVGSQKDEAERAIRLPTEMAGVSRRHCSLSRRNGQCVLQDHSRYGTFLNGHRIDSSTVLKIGDVVRVGSPGFEFQLITTDENHG